MRIISILHDSVVDGEGLRTVVFFAGCPHRCPGCHNPASWNAAGGTCMGEAEVVQEILRNPLTDVTFSGGEPFLQAAGAKRVAQAVRGAGRNLWIYTGYTLEEILCSENQDMLELLQYANVIVDGRFEAAKRTALPFCGSSNQRILCRQGGMWVEWKNSASGRG